MCDGISLVLVAFTTTTRVLVMLPNPSAIFVLLFWNLLIVL